MKALVQTVAGVLSYTAGAALLAMVVVDTADIGMQALFDRPIFGGYEIIELLLAGVGFLAVPQTFLRREHIVVELLDQVLSRRKVGLLQVVGTACSLVFVLILGYAMIRPARDMIRDHAASFMLEIPVIWHAIPVLLAVGLSIFAVGVVLAEDVARSRDRDERR